MQHVHLKISSPLAGGLNPRLWQLHLLGSFESSGGGRVLLEKKNLPLPKAGPVASYNWG